LNSRLLALTHFAFKVASAPGSPRSRKRTGILLATFRCLDQARRRPLNSAETDTPTRYKSILRMSRKVLDALGDLACIYERARKHLGRAVLHPRCLSEIARSIPLLCHRLAGNTTHTILRKFSGLLSFLYRFRAVIRVDLRRGPLILLTSLLRSLPTSRY